MFNSKVYSTYYVYCLAPKWLSCCTLVDLPPTIIVHRHNTVLTFVTFLSLSNKELGARTRSSQEHRRAGTGGNNQEDRKVARHCLQSKPYKMFVATLQPSWPSRPKTNVTLLFYFLKLYNFYFYDIFVGLTSSTAPMDLKNHDGTKKSQKNRFSGSILKYF